jgi:DNA-binding CsgD family transcriptional regulator
MDGVSRSRSYRPALLGAEAELAAARGDRPAVWTVAEQAVAAVRAGGIPDPALGWVVWQVVRTEADAAAAHSAGVRTDEPPVNRDALIEFGMGQFGTASAGDPRAAALGALCRAELARYRGGDDPQIWASVAERWSALGRPHLLAYARYREAGALLAARGSRSVASEALRSARRITDDLGAAPLAREIAILAGHARIDLTDGGATERPDAATDPARTLGLTTREAEVIRLLAAGYSNQQIADALFLSRKTASVHVSNILGKLGVENRVQAAAIAQRLGLIAEDGPGAPVTSAEDR